MIEDYRSNFNRPEILRIIKESLLEVAEQSDISMPENINEEIRIFGGDSLFDSMHIVNIIVLVEEGISDVFNIDITLADEHAMSQSKSPFKTIGTLADYIVNRLK